MAGGGCRNLFIFFLYSTTSREKGKRFETCFPALLVGIIEALSYNNANSLWQHQHQHPPAAVSPTIATVATTTITQEFTSKRNLWPST